MAFVHQTYTAIILVTLTVVVQCAGMALLIRWAQGHLAKGIHWFGPVRAAVIMVRFTSLLICLHVLEIVVWTAFYRWKCFATWESAFYFSATSYSTVGYGDVILPRAWRLMGPVEGLTSVLMCGLSAGLLFAIVTRLVERDERVTLATALAGTRVGVSTAAPIPTDNGKEI